MLDKNIKSAVIWHVNNYKQVRGKYVNVILF